MKINKKPIINFSVLFLFLIILNTNNMFSFENIESKYTEDNYKENFEGLIPELIIESPKNADYLNHLDFMPYGTYIYAPKYFQRYMGQPDLNSIHFRLYDANGGWFSKFRVYVNDNLELNIDWPGETIDFNIYTPIQTVGIYNITAQALSDRSKEWVTHHSILNVTSTSPCISPFYDDFLHIYNWWASLDWKINVFSTYYYNYSIYINNIESQYDNFVYYEDLYFDFTSNGNFNNNLGAINEIRLEIIDEMGEETINQFNITNIADSEPYIQSFNKNCYEMNHLTLWETEGFKLQVSAYSSENDLEKIVVIVNNLPIYAIDDAKNNVMYDVPIDTNSFIKLRDSYGNIESYLDFRAIAITDYGRSSPWDSGYSQSMELRNIDYNELIEKTEDVNSGRNIETLTMTEDRNSNINYNLTVVTDVITPTTLTIAGSTGRPWEDNFAYDHCEDYSENCIIFGRIYDDHDEYAGGMVFWVSVENQSAVNFPMIVKIVYPEEIHPDGINKIWDLRFMHWIENCETNERGWTVYRNESISENRDETLKKVGDKAIEVLIYSQGLYTFGIVPGNEDGNRGGFFISSFPIGFFLFSFGIAISTISLKSKIKMKKK